MGQHSKVESTRVRSLPGQGTPGGKTPEPPLSHPQRNGQGEPFCKEGTNETLPEPDEQATEPVLTEPGKHVEKTPYLR